MNWEIISLISGLILAAAALLRELSTRKKTKAEAEALDATTPAQVDALLATKEEQEYGRLLKYNELITRDNAGLRAENEEWRGRWTDLDATVQELVKGQRLGERRTSRLEGWLTAAHQHIADFQRWGERHAPGVKQPEPPPGYRPPTEEDDNDA